MKTTSERTQELLARYLELAEIEPWDWLCCGNFEAMEYYDEDDVYHIAVLIPVDDVRESYDYYDESKMPSDVDCEAVAEEHDELGTFLIDVILYKVPESDKINKAQVCHGKDVFEWA